MAEAWRILVDADANRAPSANVYTTLFTTVAAGTPLKVHVCNTTAVQAKFRIAVVPPGFALGGPPPIPGLNHHVSYDKVIEPSDEFDTVVYGCELGVRIVVRTDTSGVTFVCTGPEFS